MHRGANFIWHYCHKLPSRNVAPGPSDNFCVSSWSAKNYSATFQVLDQNNHVIYRAGATTDIPWPASAGFGELVRNGVHFQTILTKSVDGTISVMVAESDAARWSSVWPMLRIIGVSQILIFAACIGALAGAAKLGIRPIKQMATAVSQRRVGDLEPIDDQIGYEETAPLVAAFNELLAREARRLDAERGFLADAAHELRTPIGALTASAHQVVAANDDAARRAAAIRLDQGAARISHLLAQFPWHCRYALPLKLDNRFVTLAAMISVICPTPAHTLAGCRSR